MSTRGDFKAARNSCGCIVLIWLLGLGVIGLIVGAGNNGLANALGVVLGIALTVSAVWVWIKVGSPDAQEKARWERQEQTRLRKKAWKEGRK